MKSQSRKLSRRGFGRLLAASPLVTAAPPARPQATMTREEELRAANERRRTASEALAKFDLPMSTEPAFTFRP